MISTLVGLDMHSPVTIQHTASLSSMIFAATLVRAPAVVSPGSFSNCFAAISCASLTSGLGVESACAIRGCVSGSKFPRLLQPHIHTHTSALIIEWASFQRLQWEGGDKSPFLQAELFTEELRFPPLITAMCNAFEKSLENSAVSKCSGKIINWHLQYRTEQTLPISTLPPSSSTPRAGYSLYNPNQSQYVKNHLAPPKPAHLLNWDNNCNPFARCTLLNAGDMYYLLLICPNL